MADYVLPHTIPQEDERLTLMSRMLDPQMFFRLEQLGVAEGWRCLEVGAGNGSVSLAWSAPSDGGSAITGYRIYRGTWSGGESLLATVGTGTSWTDSNAANGIGWTFTSSL